MKKFILQMQKHREYGKKPVQDLTGMNGRSNSEPANFRDQAL